ncbi:MAG: hypothetical protein DRQ46_00265 [Gammaproteobacteria bacterium]|nr:MAG: hypothetical protein DRQ46_00265 [Gammaproteobacteria bacterium]
MWAALAPVFKFIAEIISNVLSKMLTTSATVSVEEPDNATLDPSDIAPDADSVLQQHDWLLDRGERSCGIQFNCKVSGGVKR